MKLAAAACVCIACFAMTGCAGIGPVEPRSAEESRNLDRQLLVTTRQDADSAVSVRGDPGAFYLRRRGYGPTPAVDRLLDQIASDYGLRRVEGWYIASIGEYCEVYEVSPEHDVGAIIARLGTHPGVSLVQEMNVFETEAIRYDDPHVSLQPALSELGIEFAHEFATGKGVTVAVVDSSVERSHPDLRGNVRSVRNIVDGRRLRGGEIHGTAVAGVIASLANNGEGIVGVAPEVGIASLRACWTVDAGSGLARCSSFSLAQALEVAIQLEVDVVNLSLAGPPDPLLTELIDAAIRRGMIVVAASPDEPGSAGGFPGSHPGVIAARSSGTSIVQQAANILFAPGAEILSTAPGDSYAFFSGNSLSAAYISGVSALVRERYPEVRAEEMILLLLGTGSDHQVNACRAITQSEVAGLCSGGDD